MHLATFEDLTNILTWSKTAQWFHHSHDTFRFEPVVNTATTPTMLVTHALFNELHPDLPDAICALLAWSLEYHDRDFTFNSRVGFTVEYYRGNLIEFKDINGKPCLAKSFTLFQNIPNTPTLLWLRATSFKSREAAYNKKTVIFITDYEVSHMEVPCDELTVQYPGWEQRWAVAKELSLGTDDLATYVLSKKPVAFSVLPINLTFDEH